MTAAAKTHGYRLRFMQLRGSREAVVFHRGRKLGSLALCVDVTGHEYPIASRGNYEVSRLREQIRDAMMHAGLIVSAQSQS